VVDIDASIYCVSVHPGTGLPQVLGCKRQWGYFRACSLTGGGRVAWVLRLVKIDAEGEGQATDVMEIERPGDLADIADLGLTLAETKRLLAGLQQTIVAAQVRDHAVRRPACPRCGGVCRVKDYQRPCGCHAFWSGHGTASPLSLWRVRRERERYRLAITLPVDTGTGPASSASLRPPDL
jgi:hypothetical protein